MFKNPRRGRQARNSTKNIPKVLDLKSSSEQIFFRKLTLGAAVNWRRTREKYRKKKLSRGTDGPNRRILTWIVFK